jgi:hypothetical protein
MTIEIPKKRSKIWGMPAGVIVGLCALGYVISLNGVHGEMIAFPLIFFPMLITIGIAAIANLAFWFATGSSPQKDSPGSLTNDERLLEAAQHPDRRWLVTCYRCLQPIAMVGAGYIAICPVIGVVLLR